MPATWIPTTDYKVLITDTRLQQITNNDEDIFIDAEDYACAVVKDYLGSRYDMMSIFLDPPNEFPVVKRWVQHIVLYQIWQRVPDKLIPERITKNYEDTLERLKDIEDGNANTMLPTLPEPDDATLPLTKFRWGSNARRSH